MELHSSAGQGFDFNHAAKDSNAFLDFLSHVEKSSAGDRQVFKQKIEQIDGSMPYREHMLMALEGAVPLFTGDNLEVSGEAKNQCNRFFEVANQTASAKAKRAFALYFLRGMMANLTDCEEKQDDSSCDPVKTELRSSSSEQIEQWHETSYESNNIGKQPDNNRLVDLFLQTLRDFAANGDNATAIEFLKNGIKKEACAQIVFQQEPDLLNKLLDKEIIYLNYFLRLSSQVGFLYINALLRCVQSPEGVILPGANKMLEHLWMDLSCFTVGHFFEDLDVADKYLKVCEKVFIHFADHNGFGMAKGLKAYAGILKFGIEVLEKNESPAAKEKKESLERKRQELLTKAALRDYDDVLDKAKEKPEFYLELCRILTGECEYSVFKSAVEGLGLDERQSKTKAWQHAVDAFNAGLYQKAISRLSYYVHGPCSGYRDSNYFYFYGFATPEQGYRELKALMDKVPAEIDISEARKKVDEELQAIDKLRQQYDALLAIKDKESIAYYYEELSFYSNDGLINSDYGMGGAVDLGLDRFVCIEKAITACSIILKNIPEKVDSILLKLVRLLEIKQRVLAFEKATMLDAIAVGPRIESICRKLFSRQSDETLFLKINGYYFAGMFYPNGVFRHYAEYLCSNKRGRVVDLKEGIRVLKEGSLRGKGVADMLIGSHGEINKNGMGYLAAADLVRQGLNLNSTDQWSAQERLQKEAVLLMLSAEHGNEEALLKVQDPEVKKLFNRELNERANVLLKKDKELKALFGSKAEYPFNVSREEPLTSGIIDLVVLKMAIERAQKSGVVSAVKDFVLGLKEEYDKKSVPAHILKYAKWIYKNLDSIIESTLYAMSKKDLTSIINVLIDAICECQTVRFQTIALMLSVDYKVLEEEAKANKVQNPKQYAWDHLCRRSYFEKCQEDVERMLVSNLEYFEQSALLGIKRNLEEWKLETRARSSNQKLFLF